MTMCSECSKKLNNDVSKKTSGCVTVGVYALRDEISLIQEQ